MIRLREKLAGIHVGKPVEIRTDDCPKVDSAHQLDGDVTVRLDRFRELEVSGRSVSVRVLDVWQHRAGGFVVRGKVVHIGDLPNLLHKRPWKPATHDPAQSAREEPEAVDPGWLDGNARLRRDQFAVEHAEELDRREVKRLTSKLREVKARARRDGVDLSPEVAGMERQLDAMERKLRDAA